MDEIKTIILEKLGDIYIFIEALAQKGITIGNLTQYDNFLYSPIRIVSYDVDNENFPKLTPSLMPEQIHNLSYSIRLSLIENFITTEKKF